MGIGGMWKWDDRAGARKYSDFAATAQTHTVMRAPPTPHGAETNFVIKNSFYSARETTCEEEDGALRKHRLSNRGGGSVVVVTCAVSDSLSLSAHHHE